MTFLIDQCDVASNWPCLLTGDQCVEGDKGPSCQKGNMTAMPVMSSCDPECDEGCYCFLSKCFCPADVSEMDQSVEDLWKIMSCASDAIGNVKGKACKKDCMMKDSDLESCSSCVFTKTKCLAGVSDGN